MKKDVTQRGAPGVPCKLPLARLAALPSLLPRLAPAPAVAPAPSAAPAPISVPAPAPVAAPAPDPAAARLLCLYCERTFTSTKLLHKHTQRSHQLPPNRRVSSRKAPVLFDFHPGCNLCAKNSGVQTASDLLALFHHLIDNHSIKYFGCKECQLRFASETILINHEKNVHQITRQNVELVNRVNEILLRKDVTIPCENLIIEKDISSDQLTCEVIRYGPDIKINSATKNMILNIPQEISESIVEEINRKKKGKTNKKGKSLALKILDSSSKDLNNPPEVQQQPKNVPFCEGLEDFEDNIVANLIIPRGTTEFDRIGKNSTKKKVRTDTLGKKSLRGNEPSVSLSRVQFKPEPKESQILSRLGLTQNRSPRAQSLRRCRKAPITENRASSENNRKDKVKAKNADDFIINKSKNDPGSKFDPDFYSGVSANVRENLLKHLDGKLGKSNLACDVRDIIDQKIQSTYAVIETPQDQPAEIHGSDVRLNAVTVFPTLLTSDQYGSDKIPHYSYGAKVQTFKKIITKNSWKWKWDPINKYKYSNEDGKIVRKIRQLMHSSPRDLSKLDIWTQLSMREKYENCIENKPETDSIDGGKNDRQKQIKELNSILDSRVFPEIELECGTGIEEEELIPAQELKECVEESPVLEGLGLVRVVTPVKASVPPVLTGEWARPRCYVCCVCGRRAPCLRLLEAHQASQHPNVHATHYELVGQELLKTQLYKHLYLPGIRKAPHLIDKSKIRKSTIARQIIPRKLLNMNQSTRILRTTTRSIKSLERECTKCSKKLLPSELHRHILECAGDYGWMMTKKKCKYKPFGARRRKLKGLYKRERPNEDEGKSDIKERVTRPKLPSRPRTKPSDAETIQRMLANLPEKRASRQIMNIQPPKIRSFLTENSKQTHIVRHMVSAKTRIQRKSMSVVTVTEGLGKKIRRVTRSVANSLQTLQQRNYLRKRNTQSSLKNSTKSVENEKNELEDIREPSTSATSKLSKIISNKKKNADASISKSDVITSSKCKKEESLPRLSEGRKLKPNNDVTKTLDSHEEVQGLKQQKKHKVQRILRRRPVISSKPAIKSLNTRGIKKSTDGNDSILSSGSNDDVVLAELGKETSPTEKKLSRSNEPTKRTVNKSLKLNLQVKKNVKRTNAFPLKWIGRKKLRPAKTKGKNSDSPENNFTTDKKSLKPLIAEPIEKPEKQQLELENISKSKSFIGKKPYQDNGQLLNEPDEVLCPKINKLSSSGDEISKASNISDIIGQVSLVVSASCEMIVGSRGNSTNFEFPPSGSSEDEHNNKEQNNPSREGGGDSFHRKEKSASIFPEEGLKNSYEGQRYSFQESMDIITETDLKVTIEPVRPPNSAEEFDLDNIHKPPLFSYVKRTQSINNVLPLNQFNSLALDHPSDLPQNPLLLFSPNDTFNIEASSKNIAKVKSAKSRRGLNDCIAMLKGKLTEKDPPSKPPSETKRDSSLTEPSLLNDTKTSSQDVNTVSVMLENSTLISPVLQIQNKNDKLASSNDLLENTTMWPSNSQSNLASLNVQLLTENKNDSGKYKINASTNKSYDCPQPLDLSGRIPKAEDLSLKSKPTRTENKKKPTNNPKLSLPTVPTRKPVYDPTLRIPQYSLGQGKTASTKNAETENKKQDCSKFYLPVADTSMVHPLNISLPPKSASQKSNKNTNLRELSYLPQTIVNTIEKLSPHYQEEIVKALPQVLAQAVEHLNLKQTDKSPLKHPKDHCDDSSDIIKYVNPIPSKPPSLHSALSLVNFSQTSKPSIVPLTSENSTQTLKKSEILPTNSSEFTNINTDIFLIDPVTGVITERNKIEEMSPPSEKSLNIDSSFTVDAILKSTPRSTTQDEIIDLTNDTQDMDYSLKNLDALNQSAKSIEPVIDLKHNEPSNESDMPAYSDCKKDSMEAHKVLPEKGTTSLRSVRIKTTMEKLKLKSIESSPQEEKSVIGIPDNPCMENSVSESIELHGGDLIEISVPTENAISSSKDLDKDINLSDSLSNVFSKCRESAIQQDEVSSTQHSVAEDSSDFSSFEYVINKSSSLLPDKLLPTSEHKTEVVPTKSTELSNVDEVNLEKQPEDIIEPIVLPTSRTLRNSIKNINRSEEKDFETILNIPSDVKSKRKTPSKKKKTVKETQEIEECLTKTDVSVIENIEKSASNIDAQQEIMTCEQQKTSFNNLLLTENNILSETALTPSNTIDFHPKISEKCKTTPISDSNETNQSKDESNVRRSSRRSKNKLLIKESEKKKTKSPQNVETCNDVLNPDISGSAIIPGESCQANLGDSEVSAEETNHDLESVKVIPENNDSDDEDDVCLAVVAKLKANTLTVGKNSNDTPNLKVNSDSASEIPLVNTDKNTFSLKPDNTKKINKSSTQNTKGNIKLIKKLKQKVLTRVTRSNILKLIDSDCDLDENLPLAFEKKVVTENNQSKSVIPLKKRKIKTDEYVIPKQDSQTVHEELNDTSLSKASETDDSPCLNEENVSSVNSVKLIENGHLIFKMHKKNEKNKWFVLSKSKNKKSNKTGKILKSNGKYELKNNSKEKYNDFSPVVDESNIPVEGKDSLLSLQKQTAKETEKSTTHLECEDHLTTFDKTCGDTSNEKYMSSSENPPENCNVLTKVDKVDKTVGIELIANEETADKTFKSDENLEKKTVHELLHKGSKSRSKSGKRTKKEKNGNKNKSSNEKLVIDDSDSNITKKEDVKTTTQTSKQLSNLKICQVSLNSTRIHSLRSIATLPPKSKGEFPAEENHSQTESQNQNETWENKTIKESKRKSPRDRRKNEEMSKKEKSVNQQTETKPCFENEKNKLDDSESNLNSCSNIKEPREPTILLHQDDDSKCVSNATKINSRNKRGKLNSEDEKVLTPNKEEKPLAKYKEKTENYGKSNRSSSNLNIWDAPNQETKKNKNVKRQSKAVNDDATKIIQESSKLDIPGDSFNPTIGQSSQLSDTSKENSIDKASEYVFEDSDFDNLLDVAISYKKLKGKKIFKTNVTDSKINSEKLDSEKSEKFIPPKSNKSEKIKSVEDLNIPETEIPTVKLKRLNMEKSCTTTITSQLESEDNTPKKEKFKSKVSPKPPKDIKVNLNADLSNPSLADKKSIHNESDDTNKHLNKSIKGRSTKAKTTNQQSSLVSCETSKNVKYLHSSDDESSIQDKFLTDFGMFTQKRPRKSTIAAKKKISQTFRPETSDTDDLEINTKILDQSLKHQKKKTRKVLPNKEENLTITSVMVDDVPHSISPTLESNPKSVAVPNSQYTDDGLSTDDASVLSKDDSNKSKCQNYCSICKKKFRRSENLQKHKMTLFHISKLSAIETKNLNSNSDKGETNESKDTNDNPPSPKFIMNPDTLVNKSGELALRGYKSLAERKSFSNELSYKPNLNDNQVNIKPNECEPAKNVVLEPLSEINSVESQDISRKTLSCDEALFFECCSLLKESKSTHKEVKLVEPFKSSEKYSKPHSNENPDTISPAPHSSQYLLPTDEPSFSNKIDVEKSTDNNEPAEYVPCTNSEEIFYDCNDQLESFVNESTEKSNEFAPGNVNFISTLNKCTNEMPKTEIEDQKIESIDHTIKLNSQLKESDDKTSVEFDPYFAESLMVRSNSEDFSDNADSMLSTLDGETQVQDELSKMQSGNDAKSLKQFDLPLEFEDKFDKIKRKAREKAQAAQEAITAAITPRGTLKKLIKKNRSKSRKSRSFNEDTLKDIKVSSKDCNTNKKRSLGLLTQKLNSKKVLTKGALKGFDGIKVSISTHEINLNSILDNSKSNIHDNATFEHNSKSLKAFEDKCTTIDSNMSDTDKYPNDSDGTVNSQVHKKQRVKKLSSKQKRNKHHHDMERKKLGVIPKNVEKQDMDIYEFFDEDDDVSDKFKFRTPASLTNKEKVSMIRKGENSNPSALSPNKNTLETQNEDSQISSLSFSDRDDFNYMSDDYIANESEDETNHSLVSMDLSGSTIRSNKKHKRPGKIQSNLKKNAIMGKIFKNNAIRNDQKSANNCAIDPSSNDVSMVGQKDLDQLFDSLLEQSTATNNDTLRTINKSPSDMSEPEDADSCSEFVPMTDCNKLEDSNVVSLSLDEFSSDKDESMDIRPYPRVGKRKIVPRLKARPSSDDDLPNPSPDNIHHLSDKMIPMNDIGIASHKSQRKCTTGKQNVLAESWSSESDFEDFRQFEEYSSIPRSERHHRRPRRSGRNRHSEDGKQGQGSSQSSKLDMPDKPPSDKTHKKSVKQHRSFQESADTNSDSFRNPSPCSENYPLKSNDRLAGPSSRKVSFNTSNPAVVPKCRSSRRKRRQPQKPFDYDDEFKPARMAEPLATQRRNKRAASEMLYYWSSSSDDDVQNASVDTSSREPEPVEQHGWIVGDSHKKLVTMLAHAKGRKIDDNASVKEKRSRPST